MLNYGISPDWIDGIFIQSVNHSKKSPGGRYDEYYHVQGKIPVPPCPEGNCSPSATTSGFTASTLGFAIAGKVAVSTWFQKWRRLSLELVGQKWQTQVVMEEGRS